MSDINLFPESIEKYINVNDLNELRQKQLRLLDQFNIICKKHEINYWLDFGTLLGSVRSKGFIEWDDDIDVSMFMDDYDKFLGVANAELPEDIFLQTSSTDKGFRQKYAKLRDCNSTFIEHHETGYETYNQGIYIDIFPAYKYPALPNSLSKYFLKLTVNSYEATKRSNGTWLHTALYFACIFFWNIIKIFPNKLFGQIPSDNGYATISKLDLLLPLSQTTFEGKLYPCPNNPKAYLSNLYGPHYMIEPPLSFRKPHSSFISTRKSYLEMRKLNTSGEVLQISKYE